jgi:hypothetical protein
MNRGREDSAESRQRLKSGPETGEGKMYFEKLALEVNAVAAGLQVVKPATVRGRSGDDQRFAFVASDGSSTYAFEIFPEVSEKEVLRTYVKKLDAGVQACIVCLKGRPSVEASELACYYGIEVMGPGKVGDFFSRKVTPPAKVVEPLRATA